MNMTFGIALGTVTNIKSLKIYCIVLEYINILITKPTGNNRKFRIVFC